MFEDDVCVNLSGVLDGKSNYVNIPFLGLFARPCGDRPEVMDEGPNFATALLLELCAGARCPHVLAHSEGAMVKAHDWEKESLQAKRLRFFFVSFFVYG